MLDRKLLLGSTVIAGFAAVLAVATPAVSFAQAAPAAPATTTADEEEEAEVEALVVTGSRIKRTEFTSTAPIQVITTENAEMRGVVDTADLLQGAPIAMTGSQFNNQLTGFLTDGGPGASTISLRGLGTSRTLVLLNGRRVAPSGARGNVGPVDLNVIPQSMVERVEILKDGASSIYGSDAVAGVVNIITKSNTDGFEASVYGTLNEQGGGEQYRASLSWGQTFDRGFISVGGSYYEQKILRRRDRDDTACSADYLVNAATGGRIDYQDTNGGYKCFNLNQNYLSTGAGNLMYPDPGVVYPDAAHGNNAPAGSGLVRMSRNGYPDTFPYAHFDDESLQNASVLSPVKRYTLFATGGFDLTDTTELYGQFLWNRRESEQIGARQFFPSINLANPGNSFGATLGSITLVAPMAYDRHQEVDYLLLTGGIRGTFGSFLEGWDWDIYAQYGKSEAEYGGLNAYNDRVLATTGASACNQALITISGGQCSDLAAPIPWTSARVVAGQFNDNERDFLFFDETGKTTYEQTVLEGTVTGNLFTLPAGPLGAAFGFQLRKEEIDDTPGPNEQANNFWGFSAAQRTVGEDNIAEVFGELEVPIFKGLPGIESLTAQISGRYTDYESYGSDSTYKLGLNWQIVPSFRIRATDGTSFRAPALYELFLGNQSGFGSQASIDPCVNWDSSPNANIQANCAAAGVPDDYNGVSYTLGGVPLSTSSAVVVTGGGAGVLKAETSEAQTIGVIWTPSFIDLSVAIDYFEIQVNDEVRRFGSSNIAYQCYSSANFPNDPFCGLLTGGAAGSPGRNPGAADPGTVPWQINGVNDSYVNVAEQVNRGIDLNIRYQHEFDFGSLTLDGQFTWQLEDKVEVLGGVVEDCNGQTYGGPACSTLDQGGPDFAGQMSARFDRGDWSAFWGVDLIGKGSDTEYYGTDVFNSARYGCSGPAAGCGAAVPSRAVYYKQFTEFTAYHDVSVRYRKDDWTLAGGVANLFDERPPAQSAGQFRIGTAALNAYDMVGRRLFINISKKW